MIKDILLKEASTRIIQNNNSSSIRANDDVKKLLLKEANIKLEKLRNIAMKKLAMPYHAGQTHFKNAINIRWNKIDLTSRTDLIDKQLTEAFRPYFYNLVQGKKTPIVSPPLVLRYEAVREIFPIPNPNLPETEIAAKNAVYFVDIFKHIIDGFGDFIKDVENVPFAMLLYYHTSMRNESDGGFKDEELTHFIKSERERLQANPVRLGDEVIGEGFYKKHAESPLVKRNHSTKTKRVYKLSDINKETSKTNIMQWISFALQNNYRINHNKIIQEIQELEASAIKRNPEQRSAIINAYTGRESPNSPVSSSSLMGRIIKALKYGCTETKAPPKYNWGNGMQGLPTETEQKKNKNCPALTLEEFRIIARSLEGSLPSVSPDEYIVPHETSSYFANGFDSDSQDPNKKMLVIPSLKKMPDKQIIYDTDQGNFLGNHLRKYGKEIEHFISKWGQWADQSLKIIRSPQTGKILATYARDHYQTDASSIGPFEIWHTSIYNRTNAETVLDIINKYPDYKSFYYSVLSKSLASTISNFNKYSEEDKTQTEIVPQFSFDKDVYQKLHNWVTSVNEEYIQRATPLKGPQNATQKNAITEQIANKVNSVARQITQAYKFGKIDTNKYIVCMSLLGNVVSDKKTPLVRNLKSISGQDNVLSPSGFELYKKYGYQVSKMLDFLSCIMTRSCQTTTDNRINKSGERVRENHASNYSAGTGKAGSTKLMFGVRYAFRAEELGNEDDEIKKEIRRARGKRKMERGHGQDVVPQTQHHQKGNPVQDFLQTSNGSKIIENITYWIGQASGTSGFHKGLDEGVGGLKTEGKSWTEVIDYINSRFPDMISQLSLIFEPLNVDLLRLQEITKRSIAKAVQDLSIDVNFQDQEGNITVIKLDGETENLSGGERLLQDDYLKQAAETNNMNIENPPEDETWTIKEQENPVIEQTETEEIQTPSPTLPAPTKQISPSIIKYMEELDDLAEILEDEPSRDEIQEIEFALRKGTIIEEEALRVLDNINKKLQGSENEEEEATEIGMVNLWEEKAANGEVIPPYKLQSLMLTIEKYQMQQLVPNILKQYNYRGKDQLTQNQPDQNYINEDDEDDFIEPKISQRVPNFIGKSKKKKSLLVNRQDLSTGRLKKSEVLNTMVKFAERLDRIGEYVLADKISLLIEYVNNV